LLNVCSLETKPVAGRMMPLQESHDGAMASKISAIHMFRITRSTPVEASTEVWCRLTMDLSRENELTWTIGAGN
jgi:hypothetical protein